MVTGSEMESTSAMSDTTVNRTSDRELVVTRTFDAPPRLVFEAFTRADLFKQWWLPRSMGMTLRSCELDARVGGQYRLVFEPEGMAFFGTYLEVTPPSRLVWTNEEGGADASVTTVTFNEAGGRTLLSIHELHPTKESLEDGIGAAEAMQETFAQLDELLAGL